MTWAELLPAQRVEHGVLPDGVPHDVDALDLGDGRSVLLLTDEDQTIHVVPARDGQRARPGDGVSERLISLAAEGDQRLGDFTLTTFGVKVTTGEQALGVDQTNESIRVGSTLLVKWQAIAEPGTHPAQVVMQALSRAGFTGTPALRGLLTWRGRLVAEIVDLVPGATDGWSWVVDDLRAAVASGHPEGAAEIGRLLGTLVADFHVALHDGLTEPARSASPDEVRAWATMTQKELDRAIAICSDTEADQLQAARDEILKAWHPVDPAPVEPGSHSLVMTIHGDLHVGQVLRSETGQHLITDFDGNPVLPPAQRSLPQPPAVDVASMAQSLVHAGLVVQRHSPELDPALVDEAVTAAEEAFVRSYDETLSAAGHRALLDARLLRPLRLRQVVREFTYAAEHLQRWSYVPRAALPRLLADAPDPRL